MKILLIEPDEYYHATFADSLGSLGELLISRDAAAAESLLATTVPDAVVMELLLPDLSGYEFLDKIRNLRASRPFPVIIFTKAEKLEDLEASLGYGITGYFVKGRDNLHDIKQLLLTMKCD